MDIDDKKQNLLKTIGLYDKNYEKRCILTTDGLHKGTMHK